ncbi:membrane hypothetical protein [Frankia sp. AiPs1]
MVADRVAGGALRRWVLRRPAEKPRNPSAPIRIALRRPRYPAVVGGVLIGAVGGTLLLLVANRQPGPRDSLEIGIAAALVTVPLLVLLLELGQGSSVDTARAADPRDVLAQDRAAALLRGLFAGIVGGVAVGLSGGYAGGAAAPFLAGLVSGVALAIVGATLSGLGSAWGALGVARLWLAWRGRTPLRVMTFLADARDRGVLRHAGAAYQFRHIELQRRLASGYRHQVGDGVGAPQGRPDRRAVPVTPVPPLPSPTSANPSPPRRAARPHEDETLQRFRATVGADHFATLAMASKAARTLYDQGDYQAAWSMDEDTHARRLRVLGEDHLDTLSSANNLARDLAALGDYQAARALFEDTLSRKKRMLGDDHGSTLITAAGFADVLWALGERKAARAAYEDTLSRQRRLLGDDHPAVLLATARLAELLRNQRNVSERRTYSQYWPGSPIHSHSHPRHQPQLPPAPDVPVHRHHQSRLSGLPKAPLPASLACSARECGGQPAMSA